MKIHALLAAFFLPFILLVAVSGGLYLIGVKGDANRELLFESDGVLPQDKSAHEEYIIQLLKNNSIEPDFEYLKYSNNTITLRPSSSDHHEVIIGDGKLSVYLVQPNLVKHLVELHKGHGPTLFKMASRLFALVLFLVTLSGLWLGFTLPKLRKPLLIAIGCGVVVFIVLGH